MTYIMSFGVLYVRPMYMAHRGARKSPAGRDLSVDGDLVFGKNVVHWLD